MWVFVLQYSTYLVSSIVFDRLIKIVALVALTALVAFRHRPPTRRGQMVLALFVALLGTAAIGAALLGDAIGFLQLFKFAFAFLLLPLLIWHPPVDRPIPRPLLVGALVLGLFFSIQAMTYVIVVLRNPLPAQDTLVTLERDNNMPERSFGILGFGNTFGLVAPGKPYTRAQSWFLEPSTLGGFLTLPAFLSFGLFAATRRLRYLVCGLIIAGGIFSTFSLAAILSVEAGVLSLLVIRPCAFERQTFRRVIGSLLLLAVAFLAAAQFSLYLTHRLYIREMEKGPTQLGWPLSRKPSGAGAQYLVREGFVEALARQPGLPGPIAQEREKEITANLVAQITLRPLGVGLGGTLGSHATNSANAVVFWLIAGGVPAILCLLVLQGYVFYSATVRLLMTHDWRFRSVGAAYVAATVHGLAYGTWMNPLYLLVVGLTLHAAGYLDVVESRLGARGLK